MSASPPLDTATLDDPVAGLDTRKKYVCVLERRADGLVFFEFAIGWPELLVELLLPEPAFAEFCATHRVIRLDH